MAVTKIINPESFNLGGGVSVTYKFEVKAVVGGNRYFASIQGNVVSVQQPQLSLVPGTTSTIVQDDASNVGHPLILSTTNVASGVYSVGVVYSLDGVIVTYANYISGFDAATKRRLTITLPIGVPSLQYICYYHLNMGNVVINIDDTANSRYLQLPRLTRAERISMPTPVVGETIFNTTTDKVEYFDGAAWYKIDYDPGLTVDYLVVAGGGGAAWGGGGAGGYRTSYGTGNINGGLTAVGTALTLEVAISYTVTVGTAGARGSGASSVGGTGGSSIFSTITSLGGLGGSPNAAPGRGDGGAAANAGTYGFAGGYNAGNSGSGGGGAGAKGVDAVGTPFSGTNGGVGLQNDITVSASGTGAFYAGGGGGGNRQGSVTGSGGNGGGGNASSNYSPISSPQSGGNNTGGGGGGSTYDNSASWNTPGLGGTGVVILRYPAGYTASSTLTHVDATVSGSTDKIITITGTGTGTVTFA